MLGLEWYLIKFHPWNTSLTLYIHLAQPHVPPTSSTIISQLIINKPAFLAQTSWLCSRSVCPTSHFILLTALRLCKPLHVYLLKNQTPFAHTLEGEGEGRNLRPSSLSQCQKPRSFFNMTFLSNHKLKSLPLRPSETDLL